MVERPRQFAAEWPESGRGIFLEWNIERQPEYANRSPLTLCSDKSGFTVVLQDTSTGDNKRVSAPLPLDAIPMLRENVSQAITMSNVRRLLGQRGGEASIAYTQVLIAKPFKGMTPAQAILEDEENAAVLERLAEELAKDSSNPANDVQIEAINEALLLRKIGELAPESDSDFAGEYYPLWTSIADGHTFSVKKEEWKSGTQDVSYRLDFRYFFGRQYPIEILAWTGSNSAGKYRKRNEIVLNLSTNKFIALLDRMYRLMSLFENMVFEDQYRLYREMTGQTKAENEVPESEDEDLLRMLEELDS